MNAIMKNVWVGAAGGILSTLVVGAASQLLPLGSRLVFPADAVIAVAGDCPPGWHRYDAASGRYIVGADGKDLEAGTMGEVGGTRLEYRDEDLTGNPEISVSAPRAPRRDSPLIGPGVSSGYIALTLCERR